MSETQQSCGARPSPETRPRVVIVGAGFGGLAAARGLKDAAVDVTIIDRQNHHLFQPLLYQVATAAVSPADVAVPVRSLFRGARNIRVLHDAVTGVDVAARAVVTPRGRYDYDYLILATGSEYTYFGKDHWRAHAVSLKSLEDALIMREKILLAFERAEMETDAAARRKLMTFIVIGGGPTGVELAGAIAELAKSTLARDFRQIVPGEATVVLLEAGPSLLNGFPPRLIAFAQRALERKGVAVRLDTPVED
ncbi:MAG: FAD-dependent oxidoreductase, partial [Alphaproteobacteria bacterium]|nr:FAD-dependent oxidoreductase [Alphaproteobacteria bacterium]